DFIDEEIRDRALVNGPVDEEGEVSEGAEVFHNFGYFLFGFLLLCGKCVIRLRLTPARQVRDAWSGRAPGLLQRIEYIIQHGRTLPPLGELIFYTDRTLYIERR